MIIEARFDLSKGIRMGKGKVSLENAGEVYIPTLFDANRFAEPSTNHDFSSKFRADSGKAFDQDVIQFTGEVFLINDGTKRFFFRDWIPFTLGRGDDIRSARKNFPMATHGMRITLQTIEDDNDEFVPAEEMIQRPLADNRHIAEVQRAAIEVCDENRDTPTGNLLQEINSAN